MTSCTIIADSLAPSKIRITTFVLTYPRFIHSEFMTHRVFSRNASSSRAIPVLKQIREIMTNPAIPLSFTRNQKGMQGGKALSGEEHQRALECWLDARDKAVHAAKKLSELEVHKQYANRILEPFSYISVVCTSTDFNNFFILRRHSDAQPEIQTLANQMYDALYSSKPELLSSGEWHLPFVNKNEFKNINDAIKCSVARCARVSYKNHDGSDTTIEQDLALYNRLVGGNPIHASPAEHQAMAIEDANVISGNFKGWIQYRKTLANENNI